MVDIDFDEIDRKQPSSESDDSLLSRYIKSPSVQLGKLTQSSFDIQELIDFYDGDTKPTTLPEHPDTAKDVANIFEKVQLSWSGSSIGWYGVVDHSNHGKYVGDVMVGPIDWDRSQASIKFYIPDKKNCIPDVIGSMAFVLANDLGINLIRVHAKEDSAQQTNSIITSFNGEYEGERRVYDHREQFSLVHTWSVTAPEILDDENSVQTEFSYDSEEEE